MKRGSGAEADSLELLLDTICNLFGGVLFIALMVCLMLQLSSPASSSSEALSSLLRAAELRSEARVLHSQVQALQATLDTQNKLLREFVGRDASELAQQLSERNQEKQQLTEARDQAQREVRSSQTEIGESEKQARDFETRLREAQSELQTTQAKLDKERAARTRTIRTPVVRRSSKQLVAVIVRHGRMYVWHRYSETGERLGLNTDEFVVVRDDPNGLVTAPKPTGGIPLSAAPSTTRAVAQRLKAFSPQRFYLTVAVRNDSYEEWGHLRESLVSLGFEYDLLPLGDGPIIDRGGPERGVQ